MARKYLFADESGNFDFSRGPSATRYFILTTVSLTDCLVGNQLLELRRELAWEDRGLDTNFHATTDLQATRDRVFEVLSAHDFRVDATILEKAKAKPSIRASEEYFYQLAWYLHMKYIAPQVVRPDDELLVVGASLGTKRKRAAFHSAITDVVRQVTPTAKFHVGAWDAVSEPCLQVADYCAWALQRKWERGDLRSYTLIREKIRTEFEPFKVGTNLYY
jgi:hypothetical protein